jgi:5-enolpyruvylshikimate-3-phosphate synthase
MVDVIVKKTEKLNGEICAPPSKSYTQRMLVGAALSIGISKISNPLLSQDTKATLRAITFISGYESNTACNNSPRSNGEAGRRLLDSQQGKSA